MSKKKRLRARRRFVRNVKRIIFNIIVAPARMPRVSGSLAEQAMRACEISGVVFVGILMAHLFNPDVFKTAFVVLAALVFVSFIIMIKLGEYQDSLEELRLYVRF